MLGGGVITMAFLGRRRHTVLDPAAVGFAALTAIIICGYTLVDGVGARVAGDAHAYCAALFVLDGVILPLLAWRRRGGAALKGLRAFVPHGLAGGAMSFASYWIVIWAMTVAPIALVAALRESSVLWAALIAVLFLKEPFVPARGIAVALIVAGLALIRLQ